MPRFKQYFTVEQANQRLPLVRRIVDDILEKGQSLKACGAGPDDANLTARQDRLRAELSRLLAELESLGCLFQDVDFETGLVDFPSWRDGEEVLLCWRRDEPDIRWYHSLQGGFAGRQPLSPSELKCSSDASA